MSKQAKPRSDSGEWEPTASEEEVLDAVEQHSPAATSEVADEIGLTRQGADARLRRLHDTDTVSKKKIAASLVWFLE